MQDLLIVRISLQQIFQCQVWHAEKIPFYRFWPKQNSAKPAELDVAIPSFLMDGQRRKTCFSVRAERRQRRCRSNRHHPVSHMVLLALCMKPQIFLDPRSGFTSPSLHMMWSRAFVQIIVSYDSKNNRKFQCRHNDRTI